MRIALVHDFLTQYGGAEKVLEAFHEIWPQAPIFTLFYDPKKMKGKDYKKKVNCSINKKTAGKILSNSTSKGHRAQA